MPRGGCMAVSNCFCFPILSLESSETEPRSRSYLAGTHRVVRHVRRPSLARTTTSTRAVKLSRGFEVPVQAPQLLRDLPTRRRRAPRRRACDAGRRLRRPELLRRPGSAFTRPPGRGKAGAVGSGRQRCQRQRWRRRRRRRQRRGGGWAGGGSAASAGCDEGPGPGNGYVENFAGFENSPKHEIGTGIAQSDIALPPGNHFVILDAQSTLRIELFPSLLQNVSSTATADDSTADGPIRGTENPSRIGTPRQCRLAVFWQ